MTLSKLAAAFGRAAVYIRDVNAIVRGRAPQRIWNRLVGRAAGRVARKFYL